MTALTMTNYQDMINKYDYQLDIFEFANEIGEDMEKLYIDKFWNSIESDKWIYIDNDMLIWMGYNSAESKNNKQNYIKLLNENFSEVSDYKNINNKEFSKYAQAYLENIEFNNHNKTKHLIVSPQCFKESLMLLKTDKSKIIRKYYLLLERLFKSYSKYQLQLKDKENAELKYKMTDLSLEVKEFKRFDFDEYIYLAISDAYAKNQLIKLGKSIQPKQRMKSFNTMVLNKNKFYICFIVQVHNCSFVENLLFDIFKNHRDVSPSELLKIEFSKAVTIILDVISKYNQIINYGNQVLDNEIVFDFKSIHNPPLKQIDVFNEKFLNFENIPNGELDTYVNRENYMSVYQEEITEADKEKKMANVAADKFPSHLTATDGGYRYILVNNTKQYMCDYCNYGFKEKKYLRNYVKTVHFNYSVDDVMNNNKLLCKEEDYYYFIHNNLKFYVCPRCGYTFKLRAAVVKHLKNQTACKVIQYTKFNTNDDIISAISNLLLHSCKDCNFVSKSKDHLTRHLNSLTACQYNINFKT